MKDEVPLRFPKVHSPFERSENDNGEYTVDPQVNDGYEWYDDDDTVAIEKLDGTNGAVRVGEVHGDTRVVEAYTRFGPEGFQRADPYGSTQHQYIVRGAQNSQRRGYIPDEPGVYYGEFVGPSFQGNQHELDERLFIPFSWLADKCAYKSWGEYGTSMEDIEAWFRDELFSLFYSRMHGVDLDDASVSNGTFCEGVIIAKPSETAFTEASLAVAEEHLANGQYRKYAPYLVKIRRDMFDHDGWPGPIPGH